MKLADLPIRRRRKEARPQELIDAALELFVEKGFASTRAEEVAALAGVSKGTLYLYFPSKEDLLKAVIEQCLSARITEGVAQAAGFDGPRAELLRTMLVDWWTHLYNTPASGVFKLMITEVRNFPDIAAYYASAVVEPAHRLLGGVVRSGIARGEFRDVNVDAAVHSLILPMIMLCLHKHSLGVCLPENHLTIGPEFIRQHVDLMLGGLIAAPATTPATPNTKRPR